MIYFPDTFLKPIFLDPLAPRDFSFSIIVYETSVSDKVFLIMFTVLSLELSSTNMISKSLKL